MWKLEKWHKDGSYEGAVLPATWPQICKMYFSALNSGQFTRVRAELIQ